MKWIKRLFLAIVLLAILAIGSGLVLRSMSRSRPDWYPARVLDKASMRAAAKSVEDKLVGVQNWAVNTNANERNRQSGIKPGSPGYIPAPEAIKHLTFTEAELNAFFLKWDDSMHWKDHYSAYVDEPVLVLQDNRLILAGTVKEMDTVVSVHFQPALDPDGKLRLSIVRVMGGKLPLPRAFWDGYRQKLSAAMLHKLEQSQQGAGISDDGSANSDAVAAAMNELLLNAVNDAPAEPFLFLKHDKLAFPVRLTDVKIDDKTIDLTVVPLTAEERKELLMRIKAPYVKPGGAKPEAAADTSANPPGRVG